MRKTYRFVDGGPHNCDIAFNFSTLKDIKKHVAELRAYYGENEPLNIKIYTEFTPQEYKKVGVKEDDIKRT